MALFFEQWFYRQGVPAGHAVIKQDHEIQGNFHPVICGKPSMYCKIMAMNQL